MDSLGGYIATIVVSLIIGYLSRFLEPKSKLLCWSPHNFFFDLKNEKIVLQSNSLTIQNVGRLPAEAVEIIYKGRPDFFQFSPPVDFEETSTPNEEHVIRIKTLGPKEWVFLQMLSYRTVPNLQNIRWRDGQAKVIQIQPQRVYPRWMTVTWNVLLLIGLGTIAYWLLRTVAYLISQMRLGT